MNESEKQIIAAKNMADIEKIFTESLMTSMNMPPTGKINPKTIEFIEKQNADLNKKAGWNSNDLRNDVDNLMKFGRVEIGWRESAGSTDYTMHVYRAWNKVVSKLEKDGIKLSEERIKHKNAYATSHGGFWNSIIFSIIP